jgi:L-seryl-tRNA(Ser) seleniumtransferase
VDGNVSVYHQLGVCPLINAKGTFTYLSGSIMPPEVVTAMAEAAQYYVDVNELQEAVGRHLAEMLGAEAALVTTGAAAALVVGMAAIVAGEDPEKVQRLPDTAGMKNEAIIQKCQRNAYDLAIRQVGVRLVEVEGLGDMADAINERTAALICVYAFDRSSPVKLPQLISLGRERGVPVFVDAAAELPPPQNLKGLAQCGADLVTFSGGKGLRGPQASGLLLGRKDLIRAASRNMCPHHAIGRPMKVGKEEAIGLMRAVELYLRRDHEAEWAQWEKRLDSIAEALADVPGVTTGRVPPEITNHVPRLFVAWDPATLGKTQDQVIDELRRGQPRIEVLVTQAGLTITPSTLGPGEEQVVARRLRQILGGRCDGPGSDPRRRKEDRPWPST